LSLDDHATRAPATGSVTREPDPRDAPWPQYADAVVELLVDGQHLVLTPCAGGCVASPRGEESCAAGPSATSGSIPWGSPTWVLAAGDPFPSQLTPAENQRRDRLLRAELDAAGITHAPALGRESDGPVREVSRAVRGVDRDDVRMIAARYGQLAVYEIDDFIRCVDVATGVAVTVRAYHLKHSAPGAGALVGPSGWLA